MKKTATTAKLSTAIAAGFPAKTSAASTKATTAPFDANHLAVALGVTPKKPTRAKKAAAPAKPAAKKAVAARPPTVLAKSGKLLGANAKGVPGTKAKPAVNTTAARKAMADGDGIKAKTNGGVKTTRTVKDTGLPSHGATNVAELAKVLGDFPRGSTFEFMDNRIDVYNLRGKMVAQVFKADKPAKGPKKPAAK